MYESLQRDYYWPRMFTDDYKTVKDCILCPHMSSKCKYQRQLKLFPPVGFLKFAPIDILGPIPRTKTENQLAVAMTDRLRKLRRAIPTAKNYINVGRAYVFP